MPTPGEFNEDDLAFIQVVNDLPGVRLALDMGPYGAFHSISIIGGCLWALCADSSFAVCCLFCVFLLPACSPDRCYISGDSHFPTGAVDEKMKDADIQTSLVRIFEVVSHKLRSKLCADCKFWQSARNCVFR